MSAWPSVRLADCASIVSGATPSTSEPAYWDGDIYWATPKDLSELEGAYISDTPRKITRKGLETCGATVLPVQSVLFSSRAPIGHVAINTVPMATNQGFKSFVPVREILDPKFLYHWLRKNRPYLESLGNGATFKEVSKAVVSRIQIPLPPLPEQRRISEILDNADALLAKRRAALDLLEALTEAIFLDMFGDPATNPKGWPIRKFDKTIRDETSRAEKLQRSDYLPGGRFPVVDQGQSVIAGYCDDEQYLCPSEPPVVVFGDHTRAVKLVRHPFVVGADGAKVLAPEPGIDAVFLAFLLRALPIPNLGYSRHMREVKRLQFPIPTSDRQQDFAQRIAGAELHREALERSQLGLEVLFASLQHRAFRGEL